MYNSTRQYRCTIIRGKSQTEMDNLLPAYAKVINQVCPCNAEDFEHRFNSEFVRYLPESDRVKKTLDNHRTEISGKLFGMYYFSEDGKVYESERTQKFLEDNDQPAFFKDICYKMQFPNGSQKISTTVVKRIKDGICIRPNAFLLKVLLIAETANLSISKRDIGYYVLNSLDVLQGKANPYEVIEAISEDRKKGIKRTIYVPGKQSSYNWQHINEQINYLELANLIRVTAEKEVVLNFSEGKTIEIFAQDWDKIPDFDVYGYDLSTVENRKKFQYAWDYYFSKISKCASQFNTSVESLLVSGKKSDQPSKVGSSINLTEFGDEGERIVYEYEKQRVGNFNPRLVNKVLSLGKTRGLGYDIQSVIAEDGDMAEFVKYIEVKSTKRFTSPDINDKLWVDTLNITRNEWIAALQHKDFYSIFRVYFTHNGITIFMLNNPAEKLSENKIQVVPITYRMDFSNSAVDGIVTEITRKEA